MKDKSVGLHRRNFLQLSATVLAGLAVNPLQAVVTNDDFYINKKLGLAFYKPSGWHFLSVKDMGEVKKQTILCNDWKGLEDIVWEYSGEPICVISKYDQNNPGNYGVYSPSISVWAELKSDYGGDDKITLDEFATQWTKTRLGYVENPQVLHKSSGYKFSGMNACHYNCQSTMVNKELPQPIKVEVQFLYAEHHNFFYCFDFIDSHEAKEKAQNHFNEFKNRVITS